MNLPVAKRFAIHLHEAKRAGRHHDIRFQIPDNSKNWDSFATRKEIPLNNPSEKILVFRTRIHSEKEALFTGEIKDGYGAGKLTLWDEGEIIIEKYNPRHIIVVFKGKKIKGRYHFLSSYYAKFNDKSKTKNQKYKAFLFFKAKNQD
jgi:hypothetical protein